VFFRRYLWLITKNPKLLSFGFLMVFFSSIGQTFFVGVFGPSIQYEFNLSHTVWGSVYMIGTLASALVFFLTGPLIDTYRLPSFTLSVCVFMVIACLFMPLVSNMVMLTIGIFLLRHSGQALARHVGTISMGRYFEKGRGRALSIAALGQPIAEAILPLLAVTMIAVFGWRMTYGYVGVALLLLSVPLVIWLLQGYDRFHSQYICNIKNSSNEMKSNVFSWTRKMVIKDIRFYLLLPSMVATPMIATAFFFHHLNIAVVKGWDPAWFTGNYLLYAATSIVTNVIAGAFIDRFSAKIVIQYTMVPLVLAALTIGLSNNYMWVLAYMVLLGLHVGFSQTASSALTPELYGVEHLGSIKSMSSVLSVLSSAIGPVLIGYLLDQGILIANICMIIAVYVSIANILLVVGLRIRTAYMISLNQ
tara:strand:- start:60 stop:1313 length:1254 start_codon:yes stop_codon:yes gene_type:complete